MLCNGPLQEGNVLQWSLPMRKSYWRARNELSRCMATSLRCYYAPGALHACTYVALSHMTGTAAICNELPVMVATLRMSPLRWDSCGDWEERDTET